MDHLPPWPEHPLCPHCGRPVSTSRFDSAKRKSVVNHLDGSLSCEIDDGNPFTFRNDGSIAFAMKTLAEFDDWPDAEEWGRFVAPSEGTIYLGYVRSPDNHRKIGRVQTEGLAVKVVERGPDGTVLVRPSGRE